MPKLIDRRTMKPMRYGRSPRINVTLPNDVYRLISERAEARGTNCSVIIREMVLNALDIDLDEAFDAEDER